LTLCPKVVLLLFRVEPPVFDQTVDRVVVQIVVGVGVQIVAGIRIVVSVGEKKIWHPLTWCSCVIPTAKYLIVTSYDPSKDKLSYTVHMFDFKVCPFLSFLTQVT
jgi:hypothetical protein